jgi:hypothetical protein
VDPGDTEDINLLQENPEHVDTMGTMLKNNEDQLRVLDSTIQKLRARHLQETPPTVNANAALEPKLSQQYHVMPAHIYIYILSTSTGLSIPLSLQVIP